MIFGWPARAGHRLSLRFTFTFVVRLHANRGLTPATDALEDAGRGSDGFDVPMRVVRDEEPAAGLQLSVKLDTAENRFARRVDADEVRREATVCFDGVG